MSTAGAPLVSEDNAVQSESSHSHRGAKPTTTAACSIKFQTQLLAKTLKMLLPIAKQWVIIGTMLELSQEDLDSIAADGGDDNNRLRKMLRLWLSQIDNPSDVWQTLAEAVEAVDSKIADKLKSQSI